MRLLWSVSLSTPVIRDSPLGRSYCSSGAASWHVMDTYLADEKSQLCFVKNFLSNLYRSAWGEGDLLLYSILKLHVVQSYGPPVLPSGISQVCRLAAASCWYLHPFSSFSRSLLCCRHDGVDNAVCLLLGFSEAIFAQRFADVGTVCSLLWISSVGWHLLVWILRHLFDVREEWFCTAYKCRQLQR
jgi:hypothetical protein